MEFISGLSVKHPEALREAGIDPAALAERFVHLTYRQIFDLGFFHGDLHPGNMYILPNGIVGLIDYGMMGSLTHGFRSSLAGLLAGLVKKDHQQVMNSILEISEERYTAQPAQMLEEVEAFSDLNLTQSLKDINLGNVLNKLLDILRRNKLRMNGAFYLGIKVFTQAEAIGRALNPDINLIALGEPYARRLIEEKYQPKHLLHVLTRLLTGGLDFLEEFPADFRNLYQRLMAGQLSLPIEHRISVPGFEPLRKTLDSTANLLAMAILTASIFIGSSILILAQMPPVIKGISLVGALGLVWGVVLGMRLAFHVWRHEGL